MSTVVKKNSNSVYCAFFFFFLFFFFFFFFFFVFLGLNPGGSQARGQIGSTAAGLYHSHSNVGSLTH